MNIKFCLKRIVLTITAPVLFMGCSVKQEMTENELSGTIIVWQSTPQRYSTEYLTSLYREAFAEFIGRFKKLYPQVNIIIEFQEDEQLVEKLEQESEKGLGPDLIYTESTNIIPLAKAKALIPLPQDSFDLFEFRFEALDQFSYQKEIYGIPLSLDTQVLCYNKNKVKKLPETLSELINQARAGYSVGIVSNFIDTFWGAKIFGGELVDAQGWVILDQGWGWVRWMEWLKNAKNQPNFILNEDDVVLQKAFIEEQLAYYVCWSTQIPFLRKSLGADKFGITMLPGQENQQAASPLIADGFLFSSASSNTQTQIALRFAQFLANTQQQTELAARLRSFIPANREAIIDPRLFPIQGILQRQSQIAEAFTLDQAEKIDAISKYGQDFYKRVMAGEISPEQAASQLTQTVNNQFQEQK